MEEWLNLVASCDAVVSVANTTIHGAGGLNIPTLCLLSRTLTGAGSMILWLRGVIGIHPLELQEKATRTDGLLRSSK